MVNRGSLLSAVVMVMLLVAQVGALSQGCMCPDKCPDPPKCCKAGYVKDGCNCCYECAKAEGEYCGGTNNVEGRCAEGLYCCNNDSKTQSGICKRLPGATQVIETKNCTESVLPTVPSDCPYPDCTISFCQDKQHKLCSARSLAQPQVPGRGKCQITSCKACFFVPEPEAQCEGCGDEITQNDSKSMTCIRKYTKCVKEHYQNPQILQLTKCKSSVSKGFIFCKVPPVVT